MQQNPRISIKGNRYKFLLFLSNDPKETEQRDSSCPIVRNKETRVFPVLFPTRALSL